LCVARLRAAQRPEAPAALLPPPQVILEKARIVKDGQW
jgi:hypothetical protein